MRYLILLALVFTVGLICIADVRAENSAHIGLLTVSEGVNNTERGGIADLYLVVKPGSGRIFIDSFPLSKLDTQITMRFASEIACDLLDRDCSNYDFFYTITASSAVVGGPSAGAAATVLTVAVLDEMPLDNGTIMTGTINSGNLIGPVAGVPAKALAAQSHGYTRVLVPAWESGLNETINRNMSIDVVPISTLEDALYYFTGKNYTAKSSLDESKYLQQYQDIMRMVTMDLCTKYGRFEDGVIILPNLSNYDINISNATSDNFAMALENINNGKYYSAASFCFSGNVKITSALFREYSDDDLKLEYATLLGNISEMRRSLDAKESRIDTISELETYMIVAERLSDARNILSRMNPENISSQQLAYAKERYSTSLIWSKFYDLPGEKFVMDEGLLKIACSKKLSEAEERVNYLEMYYPDTDIREEMRQAYNYYYEGEYALCMFKSSQIKADAGVVLSAIFVSANETEKLLNEKLNAAQRVIARQSENGVFPILGYSYYEYSKSLSANDVYSGLLYAEYSLELGNIDMYFQKKEALDLGSDVDFSKIYIFIGGMLLGCLLSFAILRAAEKRHSYTNAKYVRPTVLAKKTSAKRKK